MKVAFYFIVVLLITTNVYPQTKMEQEKGQIYLTIEQLNQWYNIGYVIYFNVTKKWYLRGTNSSELKEKYTKDEYNNYVVDRIKHMDSLGILTSRYYDTLQNRLNRTEKFNEAMAFTNHQFGNMIRSFLVERQSMDGIPAFWPEANIFYEATSKMSDSAYIDWHKERININSENKAIYKVFYGEIGFSQYSEDYQLFKMFFVKEDGIWKIDNMVIEEQTKEEATKFYEENVDRRGYFK